MPKDDDLLPKKKPAPKPPASKSGGRTPPQALLRLMRGMRAVGIVFGGFITLVGMMAVVGSITKNFWVRLVLALVVVVGIPAFAADRLLKRTKLGGGLGMVADIFAIVLLAIALFFVGVEVVGRPLFRNEGDRYAASGARGMARAAYFLGGVSPTFPDEKSAAPAGSASASASPSGSAAPGADGGK